MAGYNDITGDKLVSRPSSKAYEEGYDRIFGGKENKCPVCGGNDKDMPCAYTTERPSGCLRMKRLEWESEPSCLDAAYERRAIEQGLVDNPVFPENRRNRRV